MQPWQQHLRAGQVIPACPLALHDDGSWADRHQRALVRYYVDAGAGGLAVGVHSTQFAIRDPQHALCQPLLQNVSQWLSEWLPAAAPFVRIAGICGRTPQAIAEAEFAQEHGYHAGLLSLAALQEESEIELIRHCTAISSTIPIVGFYLQPAVGGRVLSYAFWRNLADNERLVAIKVAPFNRYQTLDVIRAVIDSGRDDLALYTGNDDNIIVDLLTPFSSSGKTRFFDGGLLGQWAVWTKTAVVMLKEIQCARATRTMSIDWLSRNAMLTDANAAVFDAAHGFAGCIPGINEVLRRDGLLPSRRCLDPHEMLSPGQSADLDRVIAAYESLTDQGFIRDNLDRWLG
ncbi:MAG: dihydrodipicolinate synthase family protein [Pirellulaceae bacterium]